MGTGGQIISLFDKWLVKINKIEVWQVACVITLIGFSVFFIGLINPFQNDDTFQIVINPPVHSITNVFQFFQSSTFWDGQKLTGVYYRPMMTTVFSLIYTLFGAHTFPYHLVQLSIYIASAFLLYLVFKHFFKPVLALPLALIFLVHPLNSQVVYSIPTMQDALFFFFGILAIWLLISYKTTKSLWAVAACLLLSMLSKESGFVFIIMALLYLFWFNRERFRSLIVTMILPVIAYLVLKLHAVGFSQIQRAAQIDSVHLAGRLFTAPSIILFYVTKFLFPWELATGRYWVYPEFSVNHVLIPLLIDLAIIGLIICLGIRVKSKMSRDMLYAYVFFALWTSIGLALYLQIMPLDMTASETWFYFPMAGLLGMIGIVFTTFKIRLQPKWILLFITLLIGVLGVRSALRGLDYRSQYILARHDLAVSPGDYVAMNNISEYYINHHNYSEAEIYAKRSIDAYPVVTNYNNLGVALEQSKNYVAAVQAYSRALQYNNLSIVYENLGLILMVYSDPVTINHFFQNALKVYPHDYKLLVYSAIFEAEEGSTSSAKTDIVKATKYGSVPAYIYDNIMNNQPFVLTLLGRTLII